MRAQPTQPGLSRIQSSSPGVAHWQGQREREKENKRDWGKKEPRGLGGEHLEGKRVPHTQRD